MKQFRTIVSALVAAGVLMAAVLGFADNKKLNKATNTVNNVRHADPPKVWN